VRANRKAVVRGDRPLLVSGGSIKEGQMPLDFSLSDEHQMIRLAARDVVRRFEPRRAELQERMLKNHELPEELWQALAEAGFTGCVIPERYGGSGMGLLPMAIAVEELAAAGFANAMLILTAMDSFCIATNGPEAARERFLPEVAAGKLKLCFAVTEADAGSNTFRIKTTARRDGERYVVNGSKVFITGADVADYVLLVTRSMTRDECISQGLPKSFGLTLLLVDLKSPGLEMHRCPTHGIEGMNQYTLFFEDMEVPAENRVGDEHAGTMALFGTLNPERILAAATTVGVSAHCLRVACEYAHERKVFRDTPIGAYQGVQHPLAEVRIKQEAVRLLTWRAAWAVDQGLPPNEAALYSNAAKYMGAELGLQAVDAAIETLGGNGFSEEYGLIYLWDAMRLLKTAPISREMVLNYVAEHDLGLPRSY